VQAPAELRLPSAPGGIRWRAATLDDVDLAVRVYEAIAAVDHPEWAESAEEVAEEFRHSWVDVTRDAVFAFDGDEPVAFGHVYAPDGVDTIYRVFAFGGVVPARRGRGIGRALLDWQIARGRQILAASERRIPGWILASSTDTATETARLLERSGMRPARWFQQMRRELAEPIPDTPLPAGLRLEHLDEARWEAARIAKNDAFRDHWGTQPMTEEQWTGFMRQDAMREELSFLAVDDSGAIAGMVITFVHPEDFARQGYIGGYIQFVSVGRPWRGRGVAKALLGAALHASRDAGHEAVALDVDAESPTGADRLYTAMGFRTVARSVQHVLEFA